MVVLNECDADELTQDVFMQVYHHLSEFRGEAKFSTWLYRIAMNTAKSFLRKKSWGYVQPIDDIPELAGSIGDQPDVTLLQTETEKTVTEALNSLPVKLRTAIILTAIEGMGYDEAAKVEDCPKAILYWRIYKARQLLKKKLKEYI